MGLPCQNACLPSSSLCALPLCRVPGDHTTRLALWLPLSSCCRQVWLDCTLVQACDSCCHY